MIPVDPENAIFDVKLSSVVPPKVTGENVKKELTNMDLAMKLHYLRAVYYFNKEAAEGFDIYAFKKPIFYCLDVYFAAAGRIRRSELGRPFIKCNDCGVRIIEAKCKVDLDQWLEMKEDSLHKKLVSKLVLGPQLFYSPFIYLQFTKFKCGGLAIGFSWAHVLGTSFVASNFINMWSKILAGNAPSQFTHLPINSAEIEEPQKRHEIASIPLSARLVQPVGDHWITSNDCEMQEHSFHVTHSQLKHLKSKLSTEITPFEAISALIWKSLAKIREGTRTVTFCQCNPQEGLLPVLSNDQMISTVEAEFDVARAELKEFATTVMNGKKDEKEDIDAIMNNTSEAPDMIIYGANLTFVNLEQVDLHGVELNKQRPVSTYYTIDSVGDKGVVLVLQEQPYNSGTSEENDGRIVRAILPEKEIWQLKEELERDWCIS